MLAEAQLSSLVIIILAPVTRVASAPNVNVTGFVKSFMARTGPASDGSKAQ